MISHGRPALVGGVRQHQVAARGDPVTQGCHAARWVVQIAEEVQHRHQQQADRLAEIDQPPGHGMVQHLARIADVPVDHGRVRIGGQNGLAVRDRHRVDVGVDHPGGRVGALRHLVHVALGRDARADIQELADTGRGQEVHGPAEERPVGPGDHPDVGLHGGDGPAQVLVGQEVMGATEPVVVYPGRVGPLGVHPVRHPLQILGHAASRMASPGRSGLGWARPSRTRPTSFGHYWLFVGYEAEYPSRRV